VSANGLRRTAVLAGSAALAITAGVALLTALGRDEAGPVRLAPTDTAFVALGARIYRTHCAACHGVDLEGEPNWRERKPNGRLPAPPHDETGHTWHHPDDVLFSLTKYGLPKEIGGVPYASDMPAYEGILTDPEIMAVLSYIKSRWPADVVARHDALNAARLQEP